LAGHPLRSTNDANLGITVVISRIHGTEAGEAAHWPRRRSLNPPRAPPPLWKTRASSLPGPSPRLLARPGARDSRVPRPQMDLSKLKGKASAASKTGGSGSRRCASPGHYRRRRRLPGPSADCRGRMAPVVPRTVRLTARKPAPPLPRRAAKAPARTNSVDDKKLQATLKRLHVNQVSPAPRHRAAPRGTSPDSASAGPPGAGPRPSPLGAARTTPPPRARPHADPGHRGGPHFRGRERHHLQEPQGPGLHPGQHLRGLRQRPDQAHGGHDPADDEHAPGARWGESGRGVARGETLAQLTRPGAPPSAARAPGRARRWRRRAGPLVRGGGGGGGRG